MRHAISILMMMVMVLASCAVAHSGSASSHHTNMMPIAEDQLSHHKQPIEPKTAVDHHQNCSADSEEQDQYHCSNGCCTLQRVTSLSGLISLQATDEEPLLSDAILSADSRIIFDSWSNQVVDLRRFDTRKDSKSVLRSTARLRL